MKYASPLVWLMFLIMFSLSMMITCLNKTFILDWELFNIMNTPIMLTVIVDPAGTLFSATVLFISANVLSFSTVYMQRDSFPNRFTILVLLFILSMNLLIFLPHFMILLLGWDGLGIVSFILVIYYQNAKSLGAGMITALTNRVGDVMLLLSIAWTVNQGHWLITNMWDSKMLLFQVSAITIAAMTKSAQMPFSSWLPAAMAAPTPVSALVHSSTLVTAGVFLMIRFYPFLHSYQLFNKVILFIAVSTMLMAGLSATNECDMKKIIALSTLSQLGMMMTSIGFNLPSLAYFHMITHALFKALLFVCAGAFINEHMHAQDLRWMGNISLQAPIATSCISLANMALCGFPFMAGFYSKDMIMESAMFLMNNSSMVYISLISLGFTSFYSIRFMIVVLWAPNLSCAFMSMKEHLPIIMPMISLSTLSIAAGSAMTWLIPLSNIDSLPLMMKEMPIFMVSMGVLFAYTYTTFMSQNLALMIKTPLTHFASCMMWFLVPLSSQFIMNQPLKWAHNYMKLVDQGWIELLCAQGINKSININSNMYMLLTPKLPTMYLLSSMILMTSLIALSTYI